MRKRVYQYTPPTLPARERDYQLANDVLRGELDAWEILYQEAYSYVHTAAKRLGSRHFFSPEDCADMADEAFFRSYEHLERYRGLGRFRSWVLGHVRNIMRNRQRRQCTVRRNQYLLERAVAARAYFCDPLWILVELERSQFLWEAFYQLDEMDQEIIYQRVFLNTPPRELARALCLTRKQVLQHYEDARILLQWNFCRFYQSV